MTQEEIELKVGKAVTERITVKNHEWKDPDQLVDLGKSDYGTPMIVNKAAMEADVVIGIGAVVPHHIPGFSGSSKIVQPGICGFETTGETHMLSCSGADSFLGLEDNPVRRDLDFMGDKVGLKTIFNVVMNSEGGVVGAFFGEMRATFKEAVKLARKIYGIDYHETPDIVISNSFPCDLDFWQAHKSQISGAPDHQGRRHDHPDHAVPRGYQPGPPGPVELHLVVGRRDQEGLSRRQLARRPRPPRWRPPGRWSARRPM